MSTWEPYPGPKPYAGPEPYPAPVAPDPASRPTLGGQEFEAPPWGSAEVTDAPVASQELVVSDGSAGRPVDPDLDGDGRLDAAERAYAANRRNRLTWKKPEVTYRPATGWERPRGDEALEQRRRQRADLTLWQRVGGFCVAVLFATLAVFAWRIGPDLAGWCVAIAIVALLASLPSRRGR